MKKIKAFYYLLITVIFILFSTVCTVPGGSSGGGGGGGGGGEKEIVLDPIPRTTPANWTILIHFAVDNNIDTDFEANYGIISNYLSTLENIKALDVGNNIEILVLMDCYNNIRFKDGYYRLTGGSFKNDRLTPIITEVNSGSVSQIEAFMDWVITNYPGNHYMYSIFNHGSGFSNNSSTGELGGNYNKEKLYGIGFDDSQNDSLSHDEIGTILNYLKNNKLSGNNLDIFYVYACLMGGIELAYEIKDYANYLLCSEDSFPADYWSYDALGSIVANLTISAEDLGIAFCDSAYNYFSNLSIPRGFTLSLIDLTNNNIDNLYDSINTFAGLACDHINNATDASFYNKAANDAYIMDIPYYIDLGKYLDNIQAEDTANIPQNIQDAAEAAETNLNTCVAYSREYGFPDASGLTIYHNLWNAFYDFPYNIYETNLNLDFASNDWIDYIKELKDLEPSYSNPGADAYESDDDPPSSKTIIINGANQHRSFHDVGDYDFISVDFQNGETYKIETYKETDDRQTDTIIGLLNSSYTVITGDDNGGNGQFSRIIYNCTQTGTYYIVVLEGWGDLGLYQIDVKSGGAFFSYNLKSNSYDEKEDEERALKRIQAIVDKIK